MSLSESPEREPPQTVGEAIDMIEAGLQPYPRLWGTQFAGAIWDELCRSRSRSLSDMHYGGRILGNVPFRIFLAQHIVNVACDNFIQEALMGKVCFYPDLGIPVELRCAELRSATPQDFSDITHAVKFLLAFVQIDLGVPVVIQRKSGMPFVPSPGSPG